MLNIIVGPSGAGKTSLLRKLVLEYEYKNVVTCTTRDMRPGEIDGVDYNFVSTDIFLEAKKNDFFVETEEYSGGRYYGTPKDAILNAVDSDEKYVIVLTPGGLRKVKALLKEYGKSAKSFYVTASLGARVIRYIKRAGIDCFDFNDMAEISARVNRDYGMFLNIEDEVDLVFCNSEDDPEIVSAMANIVDSMQDV